jgi:hypothetical protein
VLKLLASPGEASYSVAEGADAVAVGLDGGPSRVRRTFVGSVSVVSCQWTVPLATYQYLRAFFRAGSASATAPFLVDLILDDPLPVELTARFVPGTFGLSGVKGLSRVVQARLEVVPPPPQPDVDDAVLALYEAAGEDGSDLLDLLAHLVNDRLPAA